MPKTWVHQITFPLLSRPEWARFQDMKEAHRLKHHDMLPLLLRCAEWVAEHHRLEFDAFVAQAKE